MKYSNHGPVDRPVPFAMTLSDVQVHSSFQKKTRFYVFQLTCQKRCDMMHWKYEVLAHPIYHTLSTHFAPFARVTWRAVLRQSNKHLATPLEHSNSGKKSFDSILATESIFFDSIRFANLMKLPLLRWYSNSNDGEFGEGPGGVSLRCGSFCAISVSIRQFPTS